MQKQEKGREYFKVTDAQRCGMISTMLVPFPLSVPLAAAVTPQPCNVAKLVHVGMAGIFFPYVSVSQRVRISGILNTLKVVLGPKSGKSLTGRL